MAVESKFRAENNQTEVDPLWKGEEVHMPIYGMIHYMICIAAATGFWRENTETERMERGIRLGG